MSGAAAVESRAIPADPRNSKGFRASDWTMSSKGFGGEQVVAGHNLQQEDLVSESHSHDGSGTVGGRCGVESCEEIAARRRPCAPRASYRAGISAVHFLESRGAAHGAGKWDIGLRKAIEARYLATDTGSGFMSPGDHLCIGEMTRRSRWQVAEMHRRFSADAPARYEAGGYPKLITGT